jgi:formylglycine-generating enzyme
MIKNMFSVIALTLTYILFGQAPVHRVANEISENMVHIPGGTFTMGCTSKNRRDCEDDEKPNHRVTLNAFKINKFEVTREQWEAVMGKNPSYFNNCTKCPVESVSWHDVQEFISKLNSLTGQNYRLPTEAEWEYAARGGQDYKYAGSNNIEIVAWHDVNSDYKIHPVGSKSPNGYGLYDMSGNVWEWCSDWYGSYSRMSKANPKGTSSGSERVYRGGSWCNPPESSQVFFRTSDTPSHQSFNIGFRLAASQ